MNKLENETYLEGNSIEECYYTMSKIATSPPNRPLSFFVNLKRRYIVNY